MAVRAGAERPPAARAVVPRLPARAAEERRARAAAWPTPRLEAAIGPEVVPAPVPAAWAPMEHSTTARRVRRAPRSWVRPTPERARSTPRRAQASTLPARAEPTRMMQAEPRAPPAHPSRSGGMLEREPRPALPTRARRADSMTGPAVRPAPGRPMRAPELERRGLKAPASPTMAPAETAAWPETRIPMRVRQGRQSQAAARPGQVGSTPGRPAGARPGPVGSRLVRPARVRRRPVQERPPQALATGPLGPQAPAEAAHPMPVPAIALVQRPRAPPVKRAIPTRARHSAPHPTPATVHLRAERRARMGTPTLAGSIARPRTGPSSARVARRRSAPQDCLGRHSKAAPTSKRRRLIVEVRLRLAGSATRGGRPGRPSCA
jgi:hypothetical protein